MAKLAHRQLLVVDHDIDTLELFKFVLEAEGATVVEARSALDALETLDKRQFHGLLSDIVLPDLNGCEFLHQVQTKAALKHAEIPAIAVTGLITQTIEQDVQAAGYAGYFPKPVDLDELIPVISTLTHPSLYTLHTT